MLIATAAFVVVAGLSVFSEVRQISFQKQVDQLTGEKSKLTTTIKDNTSVTAVDPALKVLAIKSELKKMESTQLLWSKIIDKLENTVPKIKETGTPVVQFRTYNGTQEGKISVSATTRNGAFDPFADIALVIKTFSSDPVFKNVFVPVVTKSLTAAGETVLSFSLTLDYKQQTF
ncbi:MAG: hypothetical protein WCT53_05905, partial [Candidatus Gracilibacteria bacterium]